LPKKPKYRNLSITLQAYLKRTQQDFLEVIKEPGRIRIVKGAYDTPKEVSFPRGEELDEIYLYYIDQLLSKKHPCSIATHHDKIQQETKKLIHKYQVSKELYEFESLFGIRNEQLARLKEEGYPTKIYFAYGKEWYLYLCNRIAEYPLNIFQALKDIVD
jgi:proline dehydrogenase